MATRARIVKLDGRRASYIDVFSEGYPEYTGKLLNRYFHEPDQINDLLALGDLKVLDEGLEATKNYQLDSKCKGPKQIRFVGSSTDLTEDAFVDYFYVYKADEHKWFLFDDGELIRL